MPPKAKKKKEAPKPPYTFTRGDATFEITALGEIAAGVMRDVDQDGRLYGWSEAEYCWQLFDRVCTPEALEALRDMPKREFNELVDAWNEHSGVVLGES